MDEPSEVMTLLMPKAAKLTIRTAKKIFAIVVLEKARRLSSIRIGPVTGTSAISRVDLAQGGG